MLEGTNISKALIDSMKELVTDYTMDLFQKYPLEDQAAFVKVTQLFQKCIFSKQIDQESAAIDQKTIETLRHLYHSPEKVLVHSNIAQNSKELEAYQKSMKSAVSEAIEQAVVVQRYAAKRLRQQAAPQLQVEIAQKIDLPAPQPQSEIAHKFDSPDCRAPQPQVEIEPLNRQAPRFTNQHYEEVCSVFEKEIEFLLRPLNFELLLQNIPLSAEVKGKLIKSHDLLSFTLLKELSVHLSATNSWDLFLNNLYGPEGVQIRVLFRSPINRDRMNAELLFQLIASYSDSFINVLVESPKDELLKLLQSFSRLTKHQTIDEYCRSSYVNNPRELFKKLFLDFGPLVEVAELSLALEKTPKIARAFIDKYSNCFFLPLHLPQLPDERLINFSKSHYRQILSRNFSSIAAHLVKSDFLALLKDLNLNKQTSNKLEYAWESKSPRLFHLFLWETISAEDLWDKFFSALLKNPDLKRIVHLFKTPPREYNDKCLNASDIEVIGARPGEFYPLFKSLTHKELEELVNYYHHFCRSPHTENLPHLFRAVSNRIGSGTIEDDTLLTSLFNTFVPLHYRYQSAQSFAEALNFFPKLRCDLYDVYQRSFAKLNSGLTTKSYIHK